MAITGWIKKPAVLPYRAITGAVWHSEALGSPAIVLWTGYLDVWLWDVKANNLRKLARMAHERYKEDRFDNTKLSDEWLFRLPIPRPGIRPR
jgi:hypothetical protein